MMHAVLRRLVWATKHPVAIDGRAHKLVMALGDRIPRRLPTKVQTKFGAIIIDPSVAVERLLAYAFDNVHLHYSRSPLGRLIASQIGQDRISIDVGANLGMYSLLAAQAGFETACFEPEPSLYRFLDTNRKIFPTVSDLAISDAAGVAKLFSQPGAVGAQSLVSNGSAATYREVSTQTFGAAVSSLGLDRSRISLIKIDVEGAEKQVAGGMDAFLSEGHRPAIWCEVRGDTGGRASGSFRDIVAAFSRHGYAAMTDELRPFDPAQAPRSVFNLYFLTA